jgi:hypothetical protein
MSHSTSVSLLCSLLSGLGSRCHLLHLHLQKSKATNASPCASPAPSQRRLPGSVRQTTVRCPKKHPPPRGVPFQARSKSHSSKPSLRFAISIIKPPLSNNRGDERGLPRHHACPTFLPSAPNFFVAAPPTASVQSVRLVTGPKK